MRPLTPEQFERLEAVMRAEARRIAEEYKAKMADPEWRLRDYILRHCRPEPGRPDYNPNVNASNYWHDTHSERWGE